MARRAVDGAYVMPAALRSVLDAAAERDGSLQLEGFQAMPESNFEYPSAFADLRQTSDRRISSLPSAEAIEGKQALAEDQPFDPRYAEVLTRLPGVDSGRATIARSGPYALQRRSGPLDVTLASGVTVDAAKRDRDGLRLGHRPARPRDRRPRRPAGGRRAPPRRSGRRSARRRASRANRRPQFRRRHGLHAGAGQPAAADRHCRAAVPRARRPARRRRSTRPSRCRRWACGWRRCARSPAAAPRASPRSCAAPGGRW